MLHHTITEIGDTWHAVHYLHYLHCTICSLLSNLLFSWHPAWPKSMEAYYIPGPSVDTQRHCSTVSDSLTSLLTFSCV